MYLEKHVRYQSLEAMFAPGITSKMAAFWGAERGKRSVTQAD
jgi:hypothetical protein